MCTTWTRVIKKWVKLILRLIYLIYLHKLCIEALCISNTNVKPVLTKASLN